MKVVAQRVHREQRSETCYVAEVVLEFTTGQFGARLWLDGDYAGLLTVGQVVAQEREADAGEVAASSEATDHHVRVLPEQLHLFHGLLADDRLDCADQTTFDPRVFQNRPHKVGRRRLSLGSRDADCL